MATSANSANSAYSANSATEEVAAFWKLYLQFIFNEVGSGVCKSIEVYFNCVKLSIILV